MVLFFQILKSHCSVLYVCFFNIKYNTAKQFDFMLDIRFSQQNEEQSGIVAIRGLWLLSYSDHLSDQKLFGTMRHSWSESAWGRLENSGPTDRKSSNFSFQWTKTLQQNNFKYITPFLNFLKAEDINSCPKQRQKPMETLKL